MVICGEEQTDWFGDANMAHLMENYSQIGYVEVTMSRILIVIIEHLILIIVFERQKTLFGVSV